MANKRSFILFHDYKKQIMSLSDVDCGQLFKAIYAYETEGEELPLPDRADMAFMFIKNALDENRGKYEDVCKKRSEYGKLGGGQIGNKNAKKADVNEETSKTSISSNKRAKRADTVTETETATVTETETATVTETYTDTDTATETETETETKTETETAAKKEPEIDVLAEAKRIVMERLHLSPSKEARGEFKNVYLTDEEVAQLKSTYTESIAMQAIELLSTRIARENRYANENHFATIKDWVITAVYEQNKKRKAAEADKAVEARNKGFDFDFENIYER